MTIVPCIGTVTLPLPTAPPPAPPPAVRRARRGLTPPAAGEPAIGPADSGTHTSTSKRLPLTSTVVCRRTSGSGSSSSVGRTRRWGRSSESREVELLLDPLGGVGDVDEVVVAQDREIGGDGRRHPFHGELVEGTDRAGDRGRAVAPPHDQLADEVVVVLADLVTVVIAGVEAHAEPVRRGELGDPTRRREELPAGGILGVDADLDGVAPLLGAHLLLAHRQRLARGDPDLPLDQVDPGDRLGDRMLDLEAGVHLEEEELAVLVDELDGAGVVVADRLRRVDRGGAHRVLDPVGQARRGGLLDQLLVAALRRAVAGRDPHDVAVVVADHLDLDVPRPRQVALDVHLVAAEEALRLALGAGHRLGHLGGGVDDLHPPARRRRTRP